MNIYLYVHRSHVGLCASFTWHLVILVQGHAKWDNGFGTWNVYTFVSDLFVRSSVQQKKKKKIGEEEEEEEEKEFRRKHPFYTSYLNTFYNNYSQTHYLARIRQFVFGSVPCSGVLWTLKLRSTSVETQELSVGQNIAACMLHLLPGIPPFLSYIYSVCSTAFPPNPLFTFYPR